MLFSTSRCTPTSFARTKAKKATRAAHIRRANLYVHRPSDICNYQGAYATTSICTLFHNREYSEDTYDALLEFIENFEAYSTKYYNLKTLDINLPFTTIDGDILQRLLNVRSSITELKLDLFAFHSPVPNTWNSTHTKIQKLELIFHDGIAFPNSGTDILQGIDTCPTIKEVCVHNMSPHNPIVRIPRKLFMKVGYTTGVHVKRY
jgi:hypothetical protein